MTELHAVAGDLYDHPSDWRRRGWTWNTGSAASWPTYSIEWRFGKTRYSIVVENPERRCRGVASVELDGSPAGEAVIPLADDGQMHHVRVVLGVREAPADALQLPTTRAGATTS